jgi:hypothetical protein
LAFVYYLIFARFGFNIIFGSILYVFALSSSCPVKAALGFSEALCPKH